MKIGLIVPANTKISPYIRYYTNFFDQHDIEYKVIVWNKKGDEKSADYTFDYKIKDKYRIHMVIGHKLFSYRCKRIIKKENIDHIILFNIAPMFCFGRRYLKQYKNQFIADVRDDSPFRRKFPNRLASISNLAYKVVVSSPKYKSWFQDQALLCHNAEKRVVEKNLEYTPKQHRNNTIKIAFAGTLIEPDRNIQIIEELKNNDHFEFIFIGRDNAGKQKVMQYVSESGIINVKFQGEYQKDQIVEIYRENADLVNIFREKSIKNRDAVPNKLYDAAIAGIPVIVFSHNEAVADYVKKYHLGIVIEDEEKVGEKIKEQYKKFDYEQYRVGRTAFLKYVLDDMNQFEVMLKEFTQT